MTDLVLALLRYIEESFGKGLILGLMACGATGYFVVLAKRTLDSVAVGMRDLATAQNETNKIMLKQQELCRCHAESQGTLIDSMTSLVAEVHTATVSNSRVQEQNMNALIELLRESTKRGS